MEQVVSTDTQVVALLFAAINALVAVIIANNRGIWVSGREFKALKDQYDKLETRVGMLETKLETQHERFLAVVQASNKAVDLATSATNKLAEAS